ncbi:GNAT family N-acetyltransferase [Microbispora sp. CSR-4]|uniref:GNAT family N-acetyltransferase n=1 Tax=Microbispora sp. CSR-4 TaxID=2592813 RepID=UPI0011CBD784|nr:GNAT family N-acetyltransferase [Microbispora sp. CSR-4]
MLVDDLDAAEVLRWQQPMHDLYIECFSVPPWSEPEERLRAFPSRLAGHVAQPGFRSALASEDGTLLGVCYGWPARTTRDADPLIEQVHDAVGPAAFAEMSRNAFEVVELMVAGKARGSGLGRTLLHRVAGGCERAWLLTLKDSPAARLYQHLGWMSKGEFDSSTGHRLVVYARENHVSVSA